MAPSADSAGVKVSENDFLQEWQKYSCVDMIASVRAGIQEFLRFRGGPNSNRHGDLRQQLVHSSAVSISDVSITSLDVLDRSHEPNGPRITFKGKVETGTNEERVGLGVTFAAETEKKIQ